MVVGCRVLMVVPFFVDVWMCGFGVGGSGVVREGGSWWVGM